METNGYERKRTETNGNGQKWTETNGTQRMGRNEIERVGVKIKREQIRAREKIVEGKRDQKKAKKG